MCDPLSAAWRKMLTDVTRHSFSRLADLECQGGPRCSSTAAHSMTYRQLVVGGPALLLQLLRLALRLLLLLPPPLGSLGVGQAARLLLPRGGKHVSHLPQTAGAPRTPPPDSRILQSHWFLSVTMTHVKQCAYFLCMITLHPDNYPPDNHPQTPPKTTPWTTTPGQLPPASTHLLHSFLGCFGLLLTSHFLDKATQEMVSPSCSK